MDHKKISGSVTWCRTADMTFLPSQVKDGKCPYCKKEAR